MANVSESEQFYSGIDRDCAVKLLLILFALAHIFSARSYVVVVLFFVCMRECASQVFSLIGSLNTIQLKLLVRCFYLHTLTFYYIFFLLHIFSLLLFHLDRG